MTSTKPSHTAAIAALVFISTIALFPAASADLQIWGTCTNVQVFRNPICVPEEPNCDDLALPDGCDVGKLCPTPVADTNPLRICAITCQSLDLKCDAYPCPPPVFVSNPLQVCGISCDDLALPDGCDVGNPCPTPVADTDPLRVCSVSCNDLEQVQAVCNGEEVCVKAFVPEIDVAGNELVNYVYERCSGDKIELPPVPPVPYDDLPGAEDVYDALENLPPACLADQDGTPSGGAFGLGGTSQWSIGAIVGGPCNPIGTPMIPAYLDLGSVQTPFSIALSGDTLECRYNGSGPQNGYEYTISAIAQIHDAAYAGGLPFVSESEITFDLVDATHTVGPVSGHYDDGPGSELDKTECEAGRAIAVSSVTAIATAWVVAQLPSQAWIPCSADLSAIPISTGGYLLVLPTMYGRCELSINLLGAWAFSGTFALPGTFGVGIVKIEGGSAIITVLGVI